MEKIAPYIAGGFNKSALALHRAVGVIQSAIQGPVVEVPVASWKKFCPEDYNKSDDNDAILIGLAAIYEACQIRGRSYEKYMLKLDKQKGHEFSDGQ